MILYITISFLTLVIRHNVLFVTLILQKREKLSALRHDNFMSDNITHDL